MSNRVFMEVNEEFEQVGGFVAVIPGIVFHLFQEIPVGRIGSPVKVTKVLIYNII